MSVGVFSAAETEVKLRVCHIAVKRWASLSHTDWDKSKEIESLTGEKINKAAVPGAVAECAATKKYCRRLL